MSKPAITQPAGARVLPLGRGHAPARPHRRRRLQAVHLPAALLQAALRRLGRGVRRPRSTRPAATTTTPVPRPNDRFQIPDGAHWADVRGASRDVGPGAAERLARHRGRQPRAPVRRLRRRSVDRTRTQLPDETLKNLIEHFSHAHADRSPTCPRTSSATATSTSSRSSPTTRPHGAGVLHQPHARPPDDADARAAAGRERSTTPPCGTGGMLISGARRGEAPGRRAPHARPLRAGAATT